MCIRTFFLFLTGEKLKNAGIAIVALPASDLCMMGREDNGNKRRGICPVQELSLMGVTATFATNNIQNLFTFTGDGDILKIGTLFCQVAQLTSENGALLCLEMATQIAAKALGVDHFICENRPADIVILGDGFCSPHTRTHTQAHTHTDGQIDAHSIPPFQTQIYTDTQTPSYTHTETKTPSHTHTHSLPSAMLLLSAPPVDRIVIKRGRIVSQTSCHRAIYR